MRIKLLGTITALITFLVMPVNIALAEPPAMAKIVREESLKGPNDPSGRPLPLVGNWARATFSLDYQLGLIKDGYPIIPWIDYKRTINAKQFRAIYGTAMDTLREWNMPFALIHGLQWAGEFYGSSEYQVLPIEDTGVGMNLDGSKMKKNSPLSPIQPWSDLGVKWTDNESIAAIQKDYPNPPLVLFIDNNETANLTWLSADTSKRYVDAYGTEQTDEFKRALWFDGWKDRYSALFAGMRSGLTDQDWIENSKIVGYNAFGTDLLGQSNSWTRRTVVNGDRFAWQWYAWDGSIPEAYDNQWEAKKKAHRRWSMQSEMMNNVFQKELAYAQNPDYWYEVIFWDGELWNSNTPNSTGIKAVEYAEDGIEYTPDFYEGWTQYTMWLLVPRVAREWRGSDARKEVFGAYFQRILDMTKRVHEHPTLRRFWQQGELVANTSKNHPFNSNVMPPWDQYDRWFHLSTPLDPPDPDADTPWGYNPIFPVWTLARVIGNTPNREWLLYAHAPTGEIQDVEVTIPNYAVVTLPKVSISGSFFLISENDERVLPLKFGEIKAPKVRLKGDS